MEVGTYRDFNSSEKTGYNQRDSMAGIILWSILKDQATSRLRDVLVSAAWLPTLTSKITSFHRGCPSFLWLNLPHFVSSNHRRITSFWISFFPNIIWVNLKIGYPQFQWILTIFRKFTGGLFTGGILPSPKLKWPAKLMCFNGGS